MVVLRDSMWPGRVAAGTYMYLHVNERKESNDSFLIWRQAGSRPETPHSSARQPGPAQGASRTLAAPLPTGASASEAVLALWRSSSNVSAAGPHQPYRLPGRLA